MVDTGSDRGIRGGVGTGQHEDTGQREHWATVYARVPDVGAALARATELGGGREYGPMDVAEHMQTGAVRDPAGNVFGVYSQRRALTPSRDPGQGWAGSARKPAQR